MVWQKNTDKIDNKIWGVMGRKVIRKIYLLHSHLQSTQLSPLSFKPKKKKRHPFNYTNLKSESNKN